MLGHKLCTVAFVGITAAASFVFSLARTFKRLGRIGWISSGCTFIALMVATIGSAVSHRPALADPGHNIAMPAKETTFVVAMSAFLNIAYAMIGQVTIPSFIAEMREPRDFWKALVVVTVAEVLLFSLEGCVIYGTSNNPSIVSPAFGSLGNTAWKYVSFSLMVPTIIFVGVLYASLSARFIFFRLFHASKHKANHTVLGWLSWTGILAVSWILAFLIAEVIPFFSDLLSIVGSLFDSFFGFIFWGVAYMRMRGHDGGPSYYRVRGARGWAGFLLNIGIIGIGFLFLGPGTYVS
jgi:hypothetical protein